MVSQVGYSPCPSQKRLVAYGALCAVGEEGRGLPLLSSKQKAEPPLRIQPEHNHTRMLNSKRAQVCVRTGSYSDSSCSESITTFFLGPRARFFFWRKRYT